MSRAFRSETVVFGICVLAAAASSASADVRVGDIFSANLNGNRVSQHRADGTLVTNSFTSGSTLAGPTGICYGPDGNLYVASSSANRVQKYNGLTGAYIGDFVTSVSRPFSCIFGPDGSFYVSSLNTVRRYDGTTGAFLNLAASGTNLSTAIGLRFGSDNLLYVVSAGNSRVNRYDPIAGTFVSTFVSPAAASFLADVSFGPDGNLYLSDTGLGTVRRYDKSTGAVIDVYAQLPASGNPQGLSWGPDGNLYIADFGKNKLFRADAAGGVPVLLSTTGLAGPENIVIATVPAPASGCLGLGCAALLAARRRRGSNA